MYKRNKNEPNTDPGGPQKLSVLFTRKNNVDCPNVYFGNPDNIETDVEMRCHLGLDFQNNCKWKIILQKYRKKHVID
jgi:hypothetical protein